MDEHQQPLSQRVVTIRTPENIELSYALAGPGSRAVAYLIDVFLMFAVLQLLINLIISAFGLLISALGVASDAWIAGIAALASFGLYNGYFIVFEWLLNGQTPGKRILHVRVIKQGGYSLRFFDTLLRNLLRVIDFLPLFYGVGLTSLLLTRDSQRLGDLLAGTLVVYQEPVQTDSLLADVPAALDSEPALPRAELAAIPHEAISLVDEYLRSRAELAPRPRQEVAAELADVIRAASGLQPLANQSVEGFLASVVRQVAQAPPSSLEAPAEAEFPSS
jgi:uncharacterized RDD family membrane protein YckC